jgi:bifunctional DNase/RNase
MEEMEVSGVYSNTQIPAHHHVLLKQKEGLSFLRIVIGAFEAAAISMAQNRKSPSRPISYDLAQTILKTVDAEIVKVQITNLHKRTYFAEVYLQDEAGATTVLDSRPSDAIALALRQGAPIFAELEILEEPEELAARIGEDLQEDGAEEEADVAPLLPQPISELDQLKEQMRRLIAEEAYEKAALLRDEIKRMEQESPS